nr:YjjG family noncanonical pyrimidine nucleotidase [Spirochaetales bacterium]
MEYDWLFIDIDDTLLDFKACEAMALTATAQDAQCELTEETYDIYKTINDGLWAALEAGKIQPKELPLERACQFEKAVGWFHSPELFNQSYLTHLSQSNAVLPGALDFLEKASQLFSLAVASNGIGDVQRGRLKASGMDKFFQLVVVSEDVGAAKPSPVFFHQALKMGKISDPETVLMIGDKRTADVQGALNCGLCACWFSPQGGDVDDSRMMIVRDWQEATKQILF